MGLNLHGIILQAAAFNTNNLTRSWNRIDIIGQTTEQIQTSAKFAPSSVVLHPTDWRNTRLSMDSYGQYILGDLQESVALVLARSWVHLPGIVGHEYE